MFQVFQRRAAFFHPVAPPITFETSPVSDVGATKAGIAQPVCPLDQTLVDSFPASDPPSWTPGIARVAPLKAISSADARVPVVAVSKPNEGSITLRKGVVSLLGAIGLVLAVPFVMLLVGLPMALFLRALVDVVSLALTLTSRF